MNDIINKGPCIYEKTEDFYFILSINNKNLA